MKVLECCHVVCQYLIMSILCFGEWWWSVVEEGFKGGWSQEAFEAWANSDPQRKKVRDELGRLKRKIKK